MKKTKRAASNKYNKYAKGYRGVVLFYRWTRSLVLSWILNNAFGRYCQRSEAEAKRKAGCEKEEGGECGSVEQQE
jgi:hypothetical protein